MACDNHRPCSRCLKRRIGHICHDEAQAISDKDTTSESLRPHVDESAALESFISQIDKEFSESTTPAPIQPTFKSPPNNFTLRLDPSLPQSPAVFKQDSENSNINGLESISPYNRFILTAANPPGETSEKRLDNIIKAKQQAGLLKPYDYAAGYDRLCRYMDEHMTATSQTRITRSLSLFRPTFRALSQTLKPAGLQSVEEGFERILLDYERVFSITAMPACLWRRTGEIYGGNKEFAEIVECSVEDLRGGKLAIYELMSEESAVSYWEKYANVAFHSGRKAVLSSCYLRTIDGKKERQCCFSFTVRRDKYSIPHSIVGNFIFASP